MDFARDLIRTFGDDRFYHALNRAAEGDPRKVRSFYVALRGDGHGWSELCHGIRLKFKSRWQANLGIDEKCPQMDERELLCRATYVISSDHKHFAIRRPELPPNIHARMVLDEQNEWTRKYADNLKKHSEGAT